eukprot:gene36118-46953_t
MRVLQLLFDDGTGSTSTGIHPVSPSVDAQSANMLLRPCTFGYYAEPTDPFSIMDPLVNQQATQSSTGLLPGLSQAKTAGSYSNIIGCEEGVDVTIL